MGVVLGRQAEVPCVLRGVFGLLHRPQGQPAYQGLLGRALNFSHELLYLHGPHLLPNVHCVAEIVDKGGQRLYLVFIRRLVGSVEERHLPPEILLRHSLVCQQHEILNEPRGHISLVGPDLHRLPPLIQDQLGFGEIEVNGSSPVASLPQYTGELRHPGEHGNHVLIFFHLLRIFPSQYPADTCVAHAVIYPDHSLSNLVVCHLPALIYGHDTAQGQPVLPRVQRADPVGQPVGQHGDHPVCQVHACSSL